MFHRASLEEPRCVGLSAAPHRPTRNGNPKPQTLNPTGSGSRCEGMSGGGRMQRPKRERTCCANELAWCFTARNAASKCCVWKNCQTEEKPEVVRDNTFADRLNRALQRSSLNPRNMSAIDQTWLICRQAKNAFWGLPWQA